MKKQLTSNGYTATMVQSIPQQTVSPVQSVQFRVRSLHVTEPSEREGLNLHSPGLSPYFAVLALPAPQLLPLGVRLLSK